MAPLGISSEINESFFWIRYVLIKICKYEQS